jgi:hypothetical protein
MNTEMTKLSSLDSCDSLEQPELIKSWLQELTSFTPQQVEAVVEYIEQQQAQKEKQVLNS